MANTVDPDQIPSGAVWPRSALFAYVIMSVTLLYVGHLPYLKTVFNALIARCVKNSVDDLKYNFLFFPQKPETNHELKSSKLTILVSL